MSTRSDAVDPDAGAPPVSNATAEPARAWSALSVDVAEAHRYETLGMLGRGGMGRVTSARDARLGRLVARKEALPGHEQRLVAEASLAARLDHPGILPVLDAGRTTDGRPFYTMSVGPGRTLQDELDAHPTALGRRPLVRAILHAAEAVAHAHRRGVVHRDLKPTNLLFGEFGAVRVADWGLAAEVGAPGARGEGTPGYASPEQLAGAPAAPCADVWSLGVMLRQTLSDADGASWGGAPAELRAIVRRTLQRDPGERYADAGALADDLAAWFDGDRVEAHVYTGTELLVRAVRAWRWPLSLALVAVVAAAGATGAAYQDMRSARDLAVAANARATEALGRSLAVQASAAARRQAWPEAVALAHRALDTFPTAEARGALAAVAAASMPEPEVVARQDTCSVTVPAAGGRAWLCAGGGALQRWEVGATSPTWSARVARQAAWTGPDGVVIAAHPDFHTLQVLDARTGVVREELSGSRALPWSVQGQGVAAALVDEDAVTVATATAVRRLPVDCDRLLAAAWSVDQTTLWVACADGSLLAGPPTGPLQRRMHLAPEPTEPSALAAWPDGRVVVGYFGGRVVRLDRHGDVEGVDDPGLGTVRQLLGAPGRSWVAVRGEVSGVAVLDRDSGAVRHRLDEDTRGPLALTEGGAGLVAVAHAVYRWTLPDRAPLLRVVAHAGVGTGTWLADGSGVALASGDGSVSVWPVRDGGARTLYRWQDSVVKGLVARGDGVSAVATQDRAVHTLAGGRVLPGENVMAYGARRIGRLPGATWIVPYLGLPAWIDDAGGVRTLPTGRAFDGSDAPGGDVAVIRTDDALWRLDARGEVARISMSVAPDFGAVAIADDGRVAIVDGTSVRVGGGASAAFVLPTPAPVEDLAWGPRGELAAGTRDGQLIVWRAAETGAAPWLVHQGHEDRVSWVAFSPDGTQIATASWDGTARVWTLP